MPECGVHNPTHAECISTPAQSIQSPPMPREIVINATPHESRIAVLDEGQVVELWVERTRQRTLVGNIYKGRVTKVLPGMQSAFVDLGLDRDAFLYISDVLDDIEDFDTNGEDEVSLDDVAPQARP